MQKKIIVHFLLTLLSLANLCHCLPLSTKSRWIIDEANGNRVKLVCANWAAHLDAMVAEGLNRRPVGEIAKDVKRMGFNCVRFTWATYMFTRFSNVTVSESLGKLGLHDAIEGIKKQNPNFLKLKLIDAHRRVVDALAENGVMAVLDNQVSKPSWCCSNDDDNGFFGDKYFDTIEWLRGLSMAAKHYNNTPTLVAMSLRNELRGPRQNPKDWYKYVKKGTNAIHKYNPNLLVLVSGLDFDLSFSFLKKTPLKLSLRNKLVYEFHRYAFSAGQKGMWLKKRFTKACEGLNDEIERLVGFLGEGQNAAPLFVTEFGADLEDLGTAESLFLDCFMGYLAEHDLDWGIWALQGGYYFKKGIRNPNETFGLLNNDWSAIRNPSFSQKLEFIQQQLRDPKSKGRPYRILHHPSSGQCVQVGDKQVYVGDCRSFSRWDFRGNGNPIKLVGTGKCLSAGGDGVAVTVSDDCSSKWEWMPGTNYQLTTKDSNGKYLCLEWNLEYETTVFTNECKCFAGDDDYAMDCRETPLTQWFKFIPANVY
ncbi:glycosyl hydrolase 5 family protein-like [Andrographis paniculata]|uniref:glycosyl hydrolase 5 family protein-like n=1 Tax=Andrographis paniculata TaxID=175694 RepID=UPI0021E81E3D|nr:glycosyl hydrolase 5 family protein-like [Andrographis paniculata]